MGTARVAAEVLKSKGPPCPAQTQSPLQPLCLCHQPSLATLLRPKQTTNSCFSSEPQEHMLEIRVPYGPLTVIFLNLLASSTDQLKRSHHTPGSLILPLIPTPGHQAQGVTQDTGDSVTCWPRSLGTMSTTGLPRNPCLLFTSPFRAEKPRSPVE